ncbi:MAG: hypothetical protein IJ187_06070 [Neisseriaceae bacterium]|nr:hypothetical protein [Neisseriaceae bacterium]MBQ9724211.1 hypothetical protein [Neisseriaceae bacterium]
MPTLISHSPQEFFALYGQLSQRKQDELFAHLRTMLEQEQELVSKNTDKNKELEEFIGCGAGEVKEVLSIEKMNEIIAAGWAGECK